MVMLKSQIAYQIKHVGMCTYVPVWLRFCSRVKFEKLESDYNQNWVKDAGEIPSYANEVKGHINGHLRTN